jgi:hypothetical protein
VSIARRLSHVCLRVVEESDVDPVELQAREAFAERAPDGGRRIVEDGGERRPADELRARSPVLEHAADLRRDDVRVARPAHERATEPFLAEAGAVEGRGVEETDACLPGGFDGRRRVRPGHLLVEARKRSGAETQPREHHDS